MQSLCHRHRLPQPALPSGEWRAVWVSYLEFAEMDFSSESAFRADAAALMDNCLSLGLNTVIAQVRPLWGCALPEQPLPVEPPVHRRAGAGPGL